MWDLVEAVATNNDFGNQMIYDAASFYYCPNVNLTTLSTLAWEKGVVDMVMAHNIAFYRCTLVSVLESAW